MSGKPRRAGIRMWAALCELAQGYPNPVATVHVLHAVQAAGCTSTNHTVARTLVAQGLAMHYCPGTGHEVGRGCLLLITEEGLSVQAGPAARRWLRDHQSFLAT